MTDQPNPIGDDAVTAFVKGYAESGSGDATFNFEGIKAGLAAVIKPLWQSGGALGNELSSWIEMLQALGYEGRSQGAQDRFSAALTQALNATFEVNKPLMDLAAALAPAPKPPATPVPDGA